MSCLISRTAAQQRFCTRVWAEALYVNQILDHLNPLMQHFITGQSQCFCLTQNPRRLTNEFSGR